MTFKSPSIRQLLLLIGDITIILISFYLALILRRGETKADFFTFQKIALFLSLIIIYITSFYIFDFYDIMIKFRSAGFLVSMGGALGLAYLFGIIIFYLFPYKLGRGVFLLSWISTGILIFGLRFTYSLFFKLREPLRNVLVLGNGEKAEMIISNIKNNPEFRIKAVLDKEKMKDILLRGQSAGGMRTMEEFIEQNRINDIVVSINSDNTSELERALVNCRMKGIRCYTYESFYERIFEKLPVLMLNDQWFLMSEGFNNLGSRLFKMFKRAFDLFVAIALLLVSVPAGVLIILLIPLTSKGPVFFVQERIGVGKKPFKLIKFRTMVQNAEINGPQWAQKDDDRVTKLGKVLRKTRLDEFPQIINVFKGEMSLIGPRPEREYFVNQLSEKIPFYSLRFFVKPGITGWAQVNYRYGADEKDAIEKLRYELYYIKNQSLILDYKILLKTIRVVLTGIGS